MRTTMLWFASSTLPTSRRSHGRHGDLKGRAAKRLRWEFREHSAVLDGRKVVYKLADHGIRLLGGKLKLRQVVRLSDDGSHQTQVVTSRRDLSAIEVAYRMFERWRQENFFKYLRDEYALDALVDYQLDAADPQRDVPNPAWAKVDAKLRKARAQVISLSARYGIAAIANREGERRTMRGFKIATAKLSRPVKDALRRYTQLEAQRAKVPRRIPVGEITDGDVVRLAVERKHLTDVIKLVAYQAETDLVRRIAPHYKRADDEARTLVTSMLANPGDVAVTATELQRLGAAQVSDGGHSLSRKAKRPPLHRRRSGASMEITKQEATDVAAVRKAKRPERLGTWDLNKVHNVDCLTGFKQLPDDCLDVIVTSPPYWGQRGAEGLGSEPDPRDYVRNLVSILDEGMRCLKPSGTLWLNVGDAYNTPINWREDDHVYSSLGKDGTGLPATNSAYTKNRGRRRAFVQSEVGWLKYGNLLAVPYRIVIAMGDLGHLFRGEVIWEKSRPMPEGLCRRPHRRHEGIYIFAKNERHAFRTKPPVGSVWKLLQTPNMTPHCSTFPIDLPIQCIRAAGIEGTGVVLDPFMGSGTTAKAAATLGHNFLGFELDQKTCEYAHEYIKDGTQVVLPLD